ncbi:MAG TPA: M56 family metallopeptidase [Flavobacterium sp.]|uniref:M56 family metallopeptidase n=1 Tax=Flavobacterium sp. TaxID=239 RepID=UPI002B4ACE12|nr:M56 family metallopeptidase [Flavobacterium sp.]HLO73061.1 M56 family metallopeptidase [Flavobacterium sp.]
MENLLLYFVKVNVLIILFYLMYVLFLRKETFFVSNRWYFLTGLVFSLILPLITFTKTIWVEPTPMPEYYEESIPIIYNSIETPIQEAPLNWSLILTSAYVVISILILLKIGIELISFFRRIQSQNIKKEPKYTLVETNTLENPFSFFNYVVINTNLFTAEELQHILTHESIHVKQKHSFDVLLGKVFCALFWANPIIWLYRKAMLQNLEFIADNETFQQIENKYLYQRTLLKVVTHQHNLSITNQFYQSLIKKRIVMLHTNQSDKKNVWKYATILPVLVGFMLLFQIETVAQVKENQQKTHVAKVEAISFSWDKNATDAEMKSDAELLKSKGIDYKFSKVKRNKNGEIIAIRIEFNDGKGNKGVKEIKGVDPIDPIYFSAEEGRIGFSTEPYAIDEKLSKQFETELEVKMVKVNDDTDYPTPPTPPTPPNHPFENLMEAPTPPDFPSVPDFPSNIDDKKAMEKYEKAMATFEKKMKAIEPKMKEFEKKMEVFEKEMKLKEPDMKKFEEEMKIFEQKMKVFEKEMEVYEKEIEKSSAEYYINGEKVSKEDVEKMQTDEIESINVKNEVSPNRIEIKKKQIKKNK